MHTRFAADVYSRSDSEPERRLWQNADYHYLAGALAKLGLKVLVFDLDGQGDLTTGVGFDDEFFADNGASVYTLLTHGECELRQLICGASNDAFDVVPGNIQMYLADKALFTVHNRERRFERLLEPIVSDYDYILVDCPPNLGTVTDNALLAFRRVLAPARMNKKNTRAITILLDQIETLEDAFRVPIDVIGVVPVGYVPDADQKQMMQELRDNMPDFLTPAIRKRETLIEDAWQSGCSIFSYRPSNTYRAKAQRESQHDYIALEEFVMARSYEVVK